MAMAAPLRSTIILAALLIIQVATATSPPKGVSLSFPIFNSAINCSIDSTANTLLKPSQICIVIDGGKRVILSADNVLSARYQYKNKVQLWKAGLKYAASFSTSYVAAFLRSGDRVESGNFNSFGGGLAFAITPDQRVGSSGAESFGLFEFDPKTGKSLRGDKTKTVAVEIDLSRGTPARNYDPQIPHLGIDINSIKSASATSLGTFPQFVDRKIATFIDYDAQKELLQVRLQNLGFAANTTVQPDKSKARLYLNFRNLRLATLVNEQSYVGFSLRVPQDENGAYFLYEWKFSTTWVPVTYL